jgi:hypothetical protein
MTTDKATVEVVTTSTIDLNDYLPVFTIESLVPGEMVLISVPSIITGSGDRVMLARVNSVMNSRGSKVVLLEGHAGHWGLERVRAVKKGGVA